MRKLTVKQQQRAMRMQMQRILQQEALAVEKQLKGYYTDWLFDRLNLTKYR